MTQIERAKIEFTELANIVYGDKANVVIADYFSGTFNSKRVTNKIKSKLSLFRYLAKRKQEENELIAKGFEKVSMKKEVLCKRGEGLTTETTTCFVKELK